MKRFLPILPLLILSACSTQPPAPATAKNEPPERRTENTTDWTQKTELYLEYPALVAGEDSRFAIHLTRLNDFKPVPAGKSSVKLTYADGMTEFFSSPKPSKAGIFGVTVKPSHAGTVTIEVSLDSPELSDSHRIADVPVYKVLSEAPTGEAAATEETMPFLKEQQWALDFGTALAETGNIRDSLTVPAEVTPRSGGQVDVTTPFAGRVTGDILPVLGSHVTQGQVLASIVPPTSVPNDRAALDLAKAEADAAVQYATKDRDRAARLVDAGAAPRKRLEEATTALSIAQARVNAADERIRQFDTARSSEGASSTAFAIRAPFSGTVIETAASLGANLKSGDLLFRILDTDRVYVSAIVPEADFPKARTVTGAEIEIPGLDRPRPAGRLVSIGKVVDAATRTFPITYEFPNTDNRIAINQTVTTRLFLNATRTAVMIPESALVDDAGRPVVFIQRSGEKFVRRPVDVGSRQSGLAEITSGVQKGDRIVVKGAYLIRLSSMSSAIPAHGHVH